MANHKAHTAVDTHALDDIDSEYHHDSKGDSLLETRQSYKPASWAYGWAWELITCALGIAAFAAIVATLKHYDGKPIPSLPGGATLNFVASTLATISKATLLAVIASAISQFKWIHLANETPRRAQELQMLDEASRGPSGSVQLLITTRFKSFVALGAVLTILSLAFDPFIQQLIQTDWRTVYAPDGNALVRLAMSLSDNNDCAFSPSDVWENAVQAALPDSASIDEIQPICPAKNCTWQPYTTLQFCSSCVDITSWARNHSRCTSIAPYASNSGSDDPVSDPDEPVTVTCSFKLPSPFGTSNTTYTVEYGNDEGDPPLVVSEAVGGQFAQYEYDFEGALEYLGVFSSSRQLAGGEAAALLGQQLWNSSLAVVGTLRFDDPDDDSYGPTIKDANLCSLRLCLQTFNTSVHNGVLQTTLTKSANMVDVKNDTVSFAPTVSAASDSEDHQGVVNITIKNSDFRDVAAALNGYFTGDLSASEIESQCETSSGTTNNVINGLQATANFSGMMERVATSMTKVVLGSSKLTSSGKVGSVETYIAIRWGWIALPAITLIGAVLFLVAAIVQTERHRVVLWKGSSLPLLFHSRIDNLNPSDVGTSSLKETERLARSTKVHLEKTERGGWMLSGS